MPKKYGKKEFLDIKKSINLWDNKNIFVRTRRISLVPTSCIKNLGEYDLLLKLCNDCDIRWFNVPIEPLEHLNNKNLFNSAYHILKKYDRAFVNILCIKDGKINSSILDKSIKLIKSTSKISDNGKDNFRLGLSVNVQPNCPFFPFSYSDGNFSFSIALELTQEINKIISLNKKLNLISLRKAIIDTLTEQIDKVRNMALDIEKNSNIKFAGFDFSLAPIIEENGSIITILKHLGVKKFGLNGTLFATAYLTNILKYFAKVYPSVGFSGVMYSLLEDVELCKINNEEGVSLDNMIKLSTMCGCGIDMVPIKEDTNLECIKASILDIYAISTKLSKPLGVRFLPIPKTLFNQEDYTNFNDDSDFISNTKVLDVPNNELLDNNLTEFEMI